MIILISGKQGAGKTTMAELLHTRLSHTGRTGVMMKFAGVLYEIHDLIVKHLGLKGIDGPLLQLLGTEWGRKTRGEDFWVEMLKKKIPCADYVIIDDCRFPNEFYAFDHEYQTFKLRLECDAKIRHGRIIDKWRDVTHESEVALDDYLDSFDMVVNTGGASFPIIVKDVMQRLEEKWQYDRGV